jgi:hypothetical protein
MKKIRANSMEEIPKRPYLSPFIQFRGTKLKKVQSKEFLGRIVWLTTPRVQSSKFKSSNPKPKKKDENVREKEVSKQLACLYNNIITSVACAISPSVNLLPN